MKKEKKRQIAHDYYLKNKKKIKAQHNAYYQKANLSFHDSFWKQFVKPFVLQRDGYKCQWKNCNETKGLDIAHLRYGADITAKNLTVFCRKHHKIFDSKERNTA